MIEPIELTYFDRCDISRMVNVLQPNGSTKQQRQVVYSNVKCAYSAGTRPAYSTVTEEKFNDGDFINRMETKDKVYLNPSYIIQQGDEFVITVRGRELKTFAGYPFVYSSHQLVNVEVTSHA